MTVALPSASTMRRNVWHALSSASDQEIRDGLDFYPGAHGLCRLIAAIHKVAVKQVAGVYAALSPMNGWYTNVANTLDIFRHYRDARVNTSQANREKALQIAGGSDPESVLRGRKVTAFYRGIANPDDRSPIAVDRHLICLALGRKLDNDRLSRIVGNDDLYSRVESVYADLGSREGIGNRLASVAWFVQRRIASGQIPLHSPRFCPRCGSTMERSGIDRGRQRYRCAKSCGRVIVERPARSRNGEAVGREFVNGKGRRCIYLGLDSPYANSGGWQYLSRYRVCCALNRQLQMSEQVDHIDKCRTNDDIRNLRVLISLYSPKEQWNHHNWQRGGTAVIAEWDEKVGKFVEHDEPRLIYGH